VEGANSSASSIEIAEGAFLGVRILGDAILLGRAGGSERSLYDVPHRVTIRRLALLRRQ
jgi:hypothetical protein